MKELTSAYDDLEKRMAIYLGLGALLFSSLYLLTQGADLFTFLIRGALAMFVATLAGWGYGHYLRGLIRKTSGEEELPENVERESRDVKEMDSRVIGYAEMPDTVIPHEAAQPRAVDFTLPAFEPVPMTAPAMSGVGAAATAAPAPSRTAAAPPPADLDDGGDLPPPPVPPGA